MNLNIDTAGFAKLAAEAGKAALPGIEGMVQFGLTALATPYGLAGVPPIVLPMLWSAINGALGLPADTPPDQTADKIADDPAAAQQALATLDAQQQYALQAQQQADATRLASQAQQTALIVNDQNSESWFARSWRPTAGWVCVVGLAVDVLLIPILQWVGAFMAITVPPAPDAAQLIALLSAMLGLSITRTATLASQDSVKKAIVAPKVVAVRR